MKGGAGDSQTDWGLFPCLPKFNLGGSQVCLTVLQGGQVISKQCRDLKVVMVGFPAMMASLAYEHGATYGILAVIIAIVTGFAMGYLFKGGGGH